MPATLAPAATPRILVVDDDESVVVTVRGVLELDGFDVSSTTSGLEALELIRSSHFDVVLTDLHMDAPSGADLLRELEEIGADTAAIVLTGYGTLDTAIDVLRHHAYDFLLKPCDVLQLRTTVSRAVDRTRLARLQMRELEQANETIRALNLELEARVEAATAELRHQITLRDEFMSTVSHDLKSPLTFIKGMASLRRRRAKPTPENQPLLDALEQIEASAGRMAQQLDELVDASRLQAGVNLELRLEPVDLLALTRGLVGQRQQTTNRHALYVSTDLDTLTGMWDGTRLGRVLDNLLDNAVKFSPRGGTVAVTVGREDDMAVLQMTDRGEGIPESDLPHIFERFHRGRNVEGRIPGTGVGLAGVRRIIELHNGTISVASRVGEGTTFTIRLPIQASTMARNVSRKRL